MADDVVHDASPALTANQIEIVVLRTWSSPHLWAQFGAYAALMRLHLIFRVANDEAFVCKMFGLKHNTVKGRLRLIAALASDAELVIE